MRQTPRQQAVAIAATATGGRTLRMVFAALVLAVMAAMFASNAFALDSENVRVAKALSNAYAEVVDHVGPAVVGIETEKIVRRSASPRGMDDPMEFFERFFDLPPGMSPRNRQQRPTPKDETTRSTGIGSGVVIDEEGHILTNNHVVADADNIKVEFASEKGRTFKAEVVGRDPNSDLAVIKLVEKPDYLPVAAMGDSEALKPGNIVIAIGSPLGFKQSVTSGVVSAKGRNLGELAYERFIQTDASINPGNSGGPLVNLDGEVVGLNTMISVRPGSSGSIGIGFAIPINQAKTVIRQLIEKGSVTRGWLGIVMNPDDKDISLQLGHDGTGVLITEVDPSGPAHKAGIRRGDLIIQFDNLGIKDNEHLRYLVAETAPGRDVPVTVLRAGERVNLSLTVEAQPDDLYTSARRLGMGGGEGGSGIEGADEVSSSLGLTVRNLDDATRKQYEIADTVRQGVVVTEVDDSGEAKELGIRPGTVIIEMDGQPVKDIPAFRRILKDSAGKEKILVYLRYGEVSRYMSMKLK
ncbi:MAG: Do family serine endopeptidase [Planctomycetaceae bacterium]|nr:Do family serine endopeptidase [Planctomycetaceae bacterium]